MHNLQRNEKFLLKIHGLGSNGEGVGYYNGFTVFVEGALPGEVIETQLYERQKRYGRGRLIAIKETSADRVTPPCPLFDRCGGCQLMHLAYAKQLEIKRQRVVDALQRIGKFEDIEVAPCLPSPAELGYRNKIQLPVKCENDKLRIGLYQRSSHDIVDVETCYIHNPLGEEVYKKVRSIVQKSGVEAYDAKTGLGELRHILIKSAINTEEALVILVTNGSPTSNLKKAASEIISCNRYVKGVVHNLNTEKDNIILGKEFSVLEGLGHIHEILCGIKFKVSPASFFQVNPMQAERLYNKALELGQLCGDETVLDAYSGVGTLSLLFSKHVKQVIGVECVPEAIEDANENAKLNDINNVTFTCAHAEDYIKTLSNCDMVLLNPPRKGCELQFLQGVIKLRPQKVIYISCDPATLARDLAILCQSGYVVDHVQPVDMFPQTSHVECIVKLNRKTEQ